VTNLSLALPVALIQGSDKVLKLEESGRLSDPGNLVFEVVGEAFVRKAGQSHLVPTSTMRVSVEFQGVAHSLLGVLVPESIKCGVVVKKTLPGFQRKFMLWPIPVVRGKRLLQLTITKKLSIGLHNVNVQIL
jgi:hypothetical protein